MGVETLAFQGCFRAGQGSRPEGGSSVRLVVQSEGSDWDQHWADFSEANRRNPAGAFRRRLVLPLLMCAPNSRVVDVGCGNGEFLAAVHSRYPGASLLGVDISASAVREAQANVLAARFRAVDLVASGCPADLRGWATHAVCSEVLEHVHDPVELLAAAGGMFGIGARVVITVPGGPMSAFDRHIGHHRHFTPDLLRRVIRDAGLQTREVFAAGFPFFNLYRLAVIARGQRVVDDATTRHSNAAFSAVMITFDLAMRISLRRLGGWQLVAVAEA
jgi:SAM-dependent methyltransferase